MKARSWLVLALLMSELLACGGGSRSVGKGKLKTPKLPPVSEDALKEFDSGMRALRLGGPEAIERATPRLQAATAKDARLWEAWHNLGVIYYLEGDDRAALEAFDKALAINPANHDSLLGRAEAARNARDYDKAEGDYRTLIDERPADQLAYARLASLFRRRKEYEKGLDVLRDALREAGADTQIYVELALIYLGQGRDELAELVLRRAVALDDKQPEVHNAIALVLLERGRDQQAFQSFDHATSLAPNYVDARFNAASVLLDAGDYGRAKQALEKVIDLAPDDHKARVALGIAQRGIKDYKGAERTWERVVADAPRKSRARGDALWNLAVLEADIKMDDASAKRALDRYLQNASDSHPKRKQAEDRRKELGR